MQKIFYSLCLLVCLSATTWAQAAMPMGPMGPKDGADLPPADLTRIKVGAAAPDFTLSNQDGQPVTLSSYRGQQPVVLVFYRGYW